MRVLPPRSNREKPAEKKEEKVWIQFIRGLRAANAQGGGGGKEKKKKKVYIEEQVYFNS